MNGFGEVAKRLCPLLPNIKIKGETTIAEDCIRTNKGKLCANYNQPELATGCCGPKCFIWFVGQTVQTH